MSGIIRIDSRVAGFSDQPIRLIGAAFADTGELVIQKTAVIFKFARTKRFKRSNSCSN